MSDWIINLVIEWSYFGVFLLMVAENVFPPIPSELIMPFAGYAAADGELSLIGVMIAGVAGSLLGTTLWYIPARMLGLARFRRLCNWFGRVAAITEADIDMADRWFARYGLWAVLFGRLVPAIRTLISVPAGLAAMPFGMFIAISAIGTAAWTGILTAAGYLLHEHYHAVEGLIDPVSTAVLVLAILVYLFKFATWRPIRSLH